ncbi:MAG: hypothetical protein GF349_04735 [Candidatus Magasanikbacteria bacterium]|nr:hypothetical protein [Candidatus Magasanikbacteria bacterium]
MSEYTQKSIESFFSDYNVTDPDLKAKLLPELTDIIYDYNMHIVNLEKETDEYKRNQIMVGIKELRDKIDEIFSDNLKSTK